MPLEIGSINFLLYLGKDNSELSGSTPSELETIPRLKDLQLRDNVLTGFIPADQRSIPYNDINISNLQNC